MGSRIDGTHHLRATPRYKLFEPSELISGGATRRVHLLNLSAGGALIGASDPPATNTLVHLRWGGRSLPARVAWRSERRFGVAFLTPLIDAEVRAVIAAQDAAVSAASCRANSIAARA